MARKPHRRARHRLPSTAHVGTAPGEGSYAGEARADVVVPHLIDYDSASLQEVDGPDLAALVRCRDAHTVSWVDVDGAHDEGSVRTICETFGLHPLWIEDVLNPTIRPKVEHLADKVLVIMHVLSHVEGLTETERVVVVLGRGWVLSFQDRPGDVWNGVRTRIRNHLGRIRARGADYLLHALMDAVVDNYLLVVRALEPAIDALEDAVAVAGAPDAPHRVAEVRAELSVVRSAAWPLREAVGVLVRNEGGLVEHDTVPFFRDIADHLEAVLDAVDQSRDRTTASIELHLALQNQRLNEAMRVLTLVSTVFMPLSFVAGVYGMNFRHMPELQLVWGYPAVLAGMAVLAVGMVIYFRRRGLM